MTFKTLTGRQKNISLSAYMIDWDGESLSKFQRGVKDFLRPYWQHSVVCEEFPCAGSRRSLDLVNISDRVAVEVQGGGHLRYNKHFHSGSLARFRDQLKRDMMKAKWCEMNDFVLVEILPEDLPLTTAFFRDRYNVTF